MSAARRKRGFEKAARLVADQVRAVGESRGFAVSRLLTHWDDIVGPDLAGLAQPVSLKYGRSFGATLTILTSGAHAPMVEMQKERIRERVNACYGYSAVQRIRITQTSAAGFAEETASFAPNTKVPGADVTDAARMQAKASVAAIGNTELRDALELLGGHVLSRRKQL